MNSNGLSVGRFNAAIAHAVELCQLDGRGTAIDHDKQTRLCVAVPIRCVTEDKAIDIGISLYGEVDIGRVAVGDSRHRVAAVACATAKQAIPRLAKYAPWNLYGLHRVDLSDAELEASAEEYELLQDQPLAEAVVKQLSESTAFHREVADAFEKAKEFLGANISYLRDEPNKARSAGWFIAECMRSDAAPNMGMWNREKASRLVGAVDDLIRRKNPNHPGYRHSADSIRSVLYMVHPPTIWAKHPPSPTLWHL